MKQDRITLEDLQALDRDEQAGMLFYLSGYMEKSPKFQEALAAAYAAQLESRKRAADRARGG